MRVAKLVLPVGVPVAVLGTVLGAVLGFLVGAHQRPISARAVGDGVRPPMPEAVGEAPQGAVPPGGDVRYGTRYPPSIASPN